MNGPLHGIKVVDLSLLLPGPLCSMYLGDMGAEVIKVENPRLGDLTRYMGSRLGPGGRRIPTAGRADGETTDDEGASPSGEDDTESGMYLMLNRNKRAVTINLKRVEGREVLFRLLESADILLEGFRPGAMTGMGLGYEQLKDRFPRLIYCAISGYGASGPYKPLAGHDGDYIAYSGLLGITGGADGMPVLPGVQIADIGGGTQSALVSILAALYARERTGRGQFLDISMMDGAFSFLSLHLGEYLASGQTPERGRMALSGGLPNYAVYRTKDGRHVMLGSLEERFFRGFLRQIGREALLDELPPKPENFAALRARLTEIFAARTRDEWSALFSHPEACLAPVNDIPETLRDPQLRERGMVVTMRHPKLGEILVIGSPFRFSDTPCTYRLHPPGHGEHTEVILGELGYGAQEIDALRTRRAI